MISNYADEEFTEYLEDFVNVEGPEKVRDYYYRPEYMKLYQRLNIINSTLGKRKEMVDGIQTGVARWKSKTIPLTTNYWDLPWEKEAYRMEKKLADDVWENNII